MAGKNSIQVLRGTAAKRTASSEKLLAGQPFFETDTGKFYVGTGGDIKSATPVVATPATHDHDYAGSSTPSGPATSANKVNSNFIVKLNGGTTEGTNMYTFNGSSAKTVDITPSSIGAAPSGHSHNKYLHQILLNFGYYKSGALTINTAKVYLNIISSTSTSYVNQSNILYNTLKGNIPCGKVSCIGYGDIPTYMGKTVEGVTIVDVEGAKDSSSLWFTVLTYDYGTAPLQVKLVDVIDSTCSKYNGCCMVESDNVYKIA